MKQMLTRFQFALAGLLVCSVASADAQWLTFEGQNRWGEKTGRIGAISGPTLSNNEIGEEIVLKIGCDDEVPTALIDQDTRGFFWEYLSYPTYSDEQHFANDTQARINGVDIDITLTGVKSGKSVGMKKGHFYSYFGQSESFLIRKEQGIVEPLAKQMAGARTFKIILPTLEYGDLIYEFDMTGARKAIQTVCPDLF